VTQDHFFLSTTAFTIIVHIIIYKLFLETVFWNPITTLMCFLCFCLYYLLVILGNISVLSSFFQPQLNGQLFQMLSNGQFWILLIGVPAFALVPDITLTLWQRVFFPNPTDVMLL
jgi:hypothetical protein